MPAVSAWLSVPPARSSRPLLSACWRYLEEAAGRGFEAIAPYIALLAMLTLRPHGLFDQSRVE